MPPPWAGPLAAARQLALTRPSARFAQLATVAAGGFPRCRTIVLRAFDEERGTLAFTTDARSAKVAELAAAPEAEICWYFDESREQFRLAGHLSFLAGEEIERRALWSALAPAARASFSWPAPGTPRAEDDLFPEKDDSPLPPPGFIVGLLDVSAVDHLSLAVQPHERRRYWREGDVWMTERLRP
jgi:PPOX class probable FMN-dependent enzyme